MVPADMVDVSDKESTSQVGTKGISVEVKEKRVVMEVDEGESGSSSMAHSSTVVGGTTGSVVASTLGAMSTDYWVRKVQFEAVPL